MKLVYGPRESIRYVASSFNIELTDDEVTQIIAADIDRINGNRMAIQKAAEAYEAFIVERAAAIVAART